MEESMPVLDRAHLARLRELDEGAGILAEAVRSYLASAPRQLQLMRELLEAGNTLALAEEAHRLAGSSGMYGLPRVRQCCLRLENCARGQELAPASALLAEVEQSFEEASPLLAAELRTG